MQLRHIDRQTKRILATAFAVLVGLGLLALLLSWGKDLDARHARFRFDENFDFESGSFTEYLQWSERGLRAAHPQASAELLANLGPFRLEPAATCNVPSNLSFRNGVVLTHDLLDSPYTMRYLATYFQERCFVVYGLLLPDHGTVPGDLLDAEWENWAAAQTFAVRELAREADNLYLAGHGIGGTLAVFAASRNADVDGLVLFAPALDARARSWRGWLAPLFGWLVPPAAWREVLPTWSTYRYDSQTWRSSIEANALINATAESLAARSVEVPVFTVLSNEDAAISTPAVLAFMEERVHPQSRTLVFGREVLAPQPQLGYLSGQLTEVGLLSLSHRGLTVPQEDPEFGWWGTSRDCGHYFRANPESYARCMAGEREFQGELLPELLAEGVMERTDSNLFYYDMLRVLDVFFAPVAPVPDWSPR